MYVQPPHSTRHPSSRSRAPFPRPPPASPGPPRPPRPPRFVPASAPSPPPPAPHFPPSPPAPPRPSTPTAPLPPTVPGGPPRTPSERARDPATTNSPLLLAKDLPRAVAQRTPPSPSLTHTHAPPKQPRPHPSGPGPPSPHPRAPLPLPSLGSRTAQHRFPATSLLHPPAERHVSSGASSLPHVSSPTLPLTYRPSCLSTTINNVSPSAFDATPVLPFRPPRHHISTHRIALPSATPRYIAHRNSSGNTHGHRPPAFSLTYTSLHVPLARGVIPHTLSVTRPQPPRLLPPPRTSLAACPLASAARSTETNPAQRTCPRRSSPSPSPSPRRPRRFGSCSELSLRSTRPGRACLRSVSRQNRDGRRAPRAHAMRYSSTCCTCMHVCMYIPQQYLHYFVAPTLDACEHFFTAPRVHPTHPTASRKANPRAQIHIRPISIFASPGKPTSPSSATHHTTRQAPRPRPRQPNPFAPPAPRPTRDPVPSSPLSSAQNSTRCDQRQPKHARTSPAFQPGTATPGSPEGRRTHKPCSTAVQDDDDDPNAPSAEQAS
ncbi:hypothetical protein HETIRDRAFT_449208 [Heterobasidion irregulare TC 32-1]|uniref:Uncharacterized protein n=1 Tax=Heterobasidion irregulare (strain TC 32-1) TaxID=747525 RepID=W4KL03_HETIT|nr:uncharacterized protein HETIRDRAFT_449208 [Heterobasidion irregulare TC 32-1]ETW86369.1 hypothetical protein HETIRDRAFT_449208 [Heterobasidion irregulare TC 32-1]